MGNQDPRKSRGGHGLFEWDKIKDDKYSGNYLGASLKAATGRWAKNRDLEWFAKPSSRDEALQSDVSKEMAEIKRLEAEAFAEALGFSGPKTLTLAAAQDSVSQAELMRVVTAEAERDLVAPGPEGVTAAQGVGFGHGYPTLGKGQLTGTNNIQDIVTAHLPISTGEDSRSRLNTATPDKKKPKKEEKDKKKKSKKHGSSSRKRSPSASSSDADDQDRKRNRESRSSRSPSRHRLGRRPSRSPSRHRSRTVEEAPRGRDREENYRDQPRRDEDRRQYTRDRSRDRYDRRESDHRREGRR